MRVNEMVKSNKLKLLLIVLLLLFYTSLLTITADAETVVVDSGECGADGDNVTWVLTGTEDDMTLTISGNGEMKRFFQVTPPWAHYRGNIKNVVIDYGVTNISENAFYNCENLTSIKIPESVSRIDAYAFEYCTALEEVSIPDSVEQFGYSGTFYFCHSLKRIKLPKYILRTYDLTFGECKNLEEVILPDMLVSIDSRTFSGCEKLKDITIPETVRTIGDGAFNNCRSLDDLVLPKQLQTIGSCAFKGCRDIRSITIPENVSDIGNCAFSYCPLLGSATFLGDPVNNVDSNTFEAAEDFVILYDPQKAGWTTPEWHGYPTYPIHDHRYGAWKTHTEATCFRAGLEMQNCEICNAPAFRHIPMVDHHNWDTDYVIDVEPTYKKEGSESIHCIWCWRILEGSQRIIPKLEKKKQQMTVSPKTVTVKYSRIKKKAQTLKVSKVLTIKNAKGTKSFKKLKGIKKITVNRTSGKVTIKKGLKKGKYKIKVQVTAAGNGTYLKGTKTKTFTVMVK